MIGVCAFLGAGCLKHTDPPPDSEVSADAAVDAEVLPDAAGDAHVTPDASPDGGDDETWATPPAEVLQVGTSGLLLRGVVLTPDAVLDPGEVLIQGDAISCVAQQCTGETGADQATWIDTRGTISPGLIDSHNHVAYNFLAEWIPNPPRTFQNRYEWADDPGYEAHIAPYANHRSENIYFCPAAKWGELRSLIHGTTTMQGQPSGPGSCINELVRNANRYHGLGYDHMRGTIQSPRDLTDADAQSLVDDFTAADQPVTRYHVHMCEGVSGNHVEEEFDSFAGRDLRVNRHQGVNLVSYETAILIHSVILTEEQLQETLQYDAKIVWSPSSNFALYGPGVTAPIQRILELGITVGMGPDWTPSGEDEMLAEMRVGLAYGLDQGIGSITPRRLWEMATWEGAEVIGLQQHIGRLEPGFKADIAVFGRRGADPYLAVIESRAEDVRLVLIDGEGYFGDDELETVTGRCANPELVDACGIYKYLCGSFDLTVPPEEGWKRDMDSLSTWLYNILEGINNLDPAVPLPADEQYGRGDELLPLIDCSI